MKRQPYVRPRDSGATIVRVRAKPRAEIQAFSQSGDVWGFGTTDDKWGGTFTHPIDIATAKAPREKVHPWSI